LSDPTLNVVMLLMKSELIHSSFVKVARRASSVRRQISPALTSM
jgi:hypothetical protein